MNPPSSALHVHAVVRERDVDLEFDVAGGETVAVLGPNGAGKSTLLSVLAGLLRPDPSDGAAVVLGGRPLDGVPPYARGIALLAQEPLLFPHLTAIDNVAFGPRARGVRRGAARETAQRHLEAVGVGHLARRKPAQLSGGQAQRVAVARALAADPELLLLDEPMAALDVEVTPALRQTLRRVLADRTTVMVTHDVLDALLLADRVVVVEGGRIVEQGPTQQVLAAPRSAFAARLAGLDLIPGTWDGNALVSPTGLTVAGLAEEQLRPGEAAAALFRPSAVSVFVRPPGGSPRNHVEVTVTDLEPLGDRMRVRAEEQHDRGVRLAADVTPAAVAELALTPGARVTFAVKATEVTIYPTAPPPDRGSDGTGRSPGSSGSFKRPAPRGAPAPDR